MEASQGSHPILFPRIALLCLRQAITRDKSPHMKPLWSVRCCQNISIPPKDPSNHCCQPLCCFIAEHQVFSELQTCTVGLWTGQPFPTPLLYCQSNHTVGAASGVWGLQVRICDQQWDMALFAWVLTKRLHLEPLFWTALCSVPALYEGISFRGMVFPQTGFLRLKVFAKALVAAFGGYR